MVAPPTTPRSFAVDVARVSAAFQDLARQMNAQFLDKQEIIRLMTISAIAGEHMVIVGPPGTAKSAMIDMFAKLIDARYFEYLLTRFTEPNELFGPVDIAADRKSTRLNSSHHGISYAVFCLKKKNDNNRPHDVQDDPFVMFGGNDVGDIE